MTVTAIAPTECTSIVDELRDVVRDVVQARGGTAEARSMLDGAGYSAHTWQILSDIGLVAAGEEPAAQVGIQLELGRAVTPSPLLSTSVGSRLLAVCGTTTAAELHAAVVDDGVTVAVALDADGVTFDGEVCVGTIPIVLDGATAAQLLLLADSESGPVLVAIDAASASCTALRTVDPTLPAARIELDRAPARLLAGGLEVDRIVDAVRDFQLLTIAALAVGGAQAGMDMAVAYAKDRVAFGRPIGGFQAIKHKLADLLLELELARAAVTEALDAEPAERSVLIAVAFVQATQAFATIARENIHVHGGIGFTWEHDAHLYARRAQALQTLFGSASHHYERIAEHVIDGSSPTAQP